MRQHVFIVLCLVLQETPEQKRVGCLAGLLLPLRNLEVPLKKGRTEPLAAHIAFSSLKWSKEDTNGVVAVHKALPTLTHLYSEVQGVLRSRPSCATTVMCQASTCLEVMLRCFAQASSSAVQD
jgi:hypothetical protein